MMRPGWALRRDRRGAAAMELVLITPFLTGMMFAALDFSGAWLTRLQLEQAAIRGVEAVSQRRGVANSYSYALTDATTAWGKPLVSSTLDNWLECDGVRQLTLTASCNGGQRARYVSITLVAEFRPMLNWGRLITGKTSGNGFNVQGDAVVRVQ